MHDIHQTQSASASDTEIRDFIIAKAYWEGFECPDQPFRCLDFDQELDLGYLPTDVTALKRNLALLIHGGLLEPCGSETKARPTSALVKDFEQTLERANPPRIGFAPNE